MPPVKASTLVEVMVTVASHTTSVRCVAERALTVAFLLIPGIPANFVAPFRSIGGHTVARFLTALSIARLAKLL